MSRSNFVNTKAVVFTLLLTSIVIVWSAQDAYGAQLRTIIDPRDETSEFEIRYQMTTFIEYEDGGQIADILRGKNWVIQTDASTPEPDVLALRNMLNQKIVSDGSGVQIEDLTVSYSATMTGRELKATIDYQIVLHGMLGSYNIGAEGGISGQRLVDLGWRGISANGPVSINGIEINMPISALATNEQAIYEHMRDTPAGQLLSMPLINAEGIKNQPLENWHFLFDPTGINIDASGFGLDDKIKGFVVSGFTMGESSLREGRQVEKKEEASFTVDRTYMVETVQSADIANISVIGFASIDKLGELEIAGVTPTAPEGYSQTSTGDFPVVIIYGMAGLAAVGGGVFFIFSNRQLKKEQNVGQTGIDPSRLRGYQTSASSGGYQTNRGEAQLVDADDYAQTRSVYDDASNTQQQQSPPPAVTSESEASCGCAASADAGNECDCQMQGQCFCDATCKCNSDTCSSAVKEMQ